MKRFLIHLLIGVICVLLVSAKPIVEDLIIDPEFVVHVSEFLDEIDERDINIKRKYKRLDRIIYVYLIPEGTIGLCAPTNRDIFVHVMVQEYLAIRLVLFHELGHCLLNLEHVPMDEGLSIMNPKLDTKNADKYFEDWEAMLDEFFEGPTFSANAGECCGNDEPCTFTDGS